MNKLYENLESLDVLEQLDDAQFDFVYLDPPYFTCYELLKEFHVPNSDAAKYNNYIKKVVENSFRCLKEDGILAFIGPEKEYTDINYRLILDQFFPTFKQIVIDRSHSFANSRNNQTSILYIYFKNSTERIPVLKELKPVEAFAKKDEKDYYNRSSLFMDHVDRPAFCFSWKGITPPKGKCWGYTRDQLDLLFTENRIEIADHKASLKKYRSEHPVTVSSVWQAEDHTKYPFSLDTKSMLHLLNLLGGKCKRILCPFERDGKFIYNADKMGFEWTAVTDIDRRKTVSMLSDIPQHHFASITALPGYRQRTYTQDIVSNTRDISALKDRIKALSDDIKKIRQTFDPDDDSELSVDQVIEKIHEQIDATVSTDDIQSCLPESENWLTPYWNKLEPESKQFIPTGFLLYNHYNGVTDMDMAPIMIEYCKSLEKELFKKMFFGYVKDLIDRNVNVRNEFPEAFTLKKTATFAQFLENAVNNHPNSPETWHFEIGKMSYVLRGALTNAQHERILRDFRSYLDRILGQGFFGAHFIDRLNFIIDLRNNCAHPSIVDTHVVDEGRQLIREKLLLILQYYME